MAKKQIAGKITDVLKSMRKPVKGATTPVDEAQAQLSLPGITIPKTSTPLATAEAAKTGRLRQTLFGSKPRQAITASGALLAAPFVPPMLGSAIGGYAGAVRGAYGGAAAPMEAPVDYSQIYNPQTALEQTYATMRQNLAGQLPSGQAEIDRLQQFSGMLSGGASSTGVSRSAGANVYDEQARKIREGNVPSTATSSVRPLAGPLAAQADALIRQGATLNDYLGFMESAASAAGIKMDQATRNRLYTLATNSYYKKANEVQEALAKLDQQYLQGQMGLAGQPQFMVDQATLDAAEQRRSAGGNQLPLEAYLNQAAREYYSQLNNKG
jgi:hypothetical protein